MNSQSHYLDYVNILQGTDSEWRFSRGNTLPLVQRPFGMAAFAPQTRGIDQWWFSPHSRVIEGVRLTHQPSPWIGDYGTMLFAPQADKPMNLFHECWTGIRAEQTEYRPEYLQVGFVRSGSVLQLVPTKRGAQVRVTFDHDMSAWVSAFNMMGRGGFEADRERGELRGWTDGYRSGKARDFKMYVVLKPLGDWVDWEGTTEGCAGEEGAYAHLMLKKGLREARFSLGISYISYTMARRSCDEAAVQPLDRLREEAAGEWEAYLSSIAIEASEEEKRTFYSCMYRTGLFPQTAHEVDDSGEPVHYSPYLGTVEPGERYIGHGFWDTYRTLLPFFALIRPELYRKIVLSALGDYREGGWLPRWIAPGEVGCMPSTLIDSVLAQGATAGLVERPVLEQILEAMEHHANVAAPEKRFGRTGILEYLRYGYVPCDLYTESVNLTLDFAYGDYCIARVAEVLGQEEKARHYYARSRSYRNLLDPQTGFMRPRDTQGRFKEGFDPLNWDLDYTESSAWQATFAVPHDLEGLAREMGGREKLLEKLDCLFAEQRPGRVGSRGFEIHEMTEMNGEPFGHCSMNNQPSFHIPYIYACFGRSEKARYWLDRICIEEFRAEPDGFPGDEDNGAMASWYILARLGLYPMCPADNTWIKLPAAVRGTVLGQEIGAFKETLIQMKLQNPDDR